MMSTLRAVTEQQNKQAVELVEYDEFAMFHENAAEVGLPYDGPPLVQRRSVEVRPGYTLSALVWGEGAPEIVLLHGGAQNAHTWDTVALALGRPLVAIDLPGHGHSDGRLDVGVSPADYAQDVAVAIRALAPDARAVVGMSLGGLTALALAAHAPELVRRLVLVDVTPGVNQEKGSSIAAFINGPASFPSFDEILARTVEFNPTRSESSLRRGILHNAVQQPDGSWVWRYRRWRVIGESEGGTAAAHPDFGSLWDAVDSVGVPMMLLRGADSPVVDDDDVTELRRRRPEVRVELVEKAGHSIQGDQPLELTRLLEDFLGA
jgi:pimeloyl-ACP methyl ester carboxylesterase